MFENWAKNWEVFVKIKFEHYLQNTVPVLFLFPFFNQNSKSEQSIINWHMLIHITYEIEFETENYICFSYYYNISFAFI